MALENRIDLRVSQKLVLTPQLQQAIKLLQMPQLELAQAISAELTENPFLEEYQEEEHDEYRNEYEGDENEDTNYKSNEDGELTFDRQVDFSVDDYFDERSSDGRDLGYFNAGAEELPSYELFSTKQPDLYDHLLWQLRLATADDSIRRTAEAVIGNINGDGYLIASDAELIEISGETPENVEAAIALVQEFDPPGVGARDLRECLLLQVKTFELNGTIVEDIIRNNLDDLQKKRYANIARQYGATVEQVMDALRLIEKFEPKPGKSFPGEEVSYIVPDVYITRTDQGFNIVLNDEGIPKLRLNAGYRSLLKKDARGQLTKEEREFLKEKLKLATELMKSLDQRNKTIYKVTQSILNFHLDFFEMGARYVKPLNLRDVAQDIGMHESTISRVTSHKFLACEHGVFSFRYFFSSAIQSANGDVSSNLVRDLIKSVITAEDTHAPLSDQMIADKLNAQNINIARRTVAKYREELKIPTQSRRKKV